MPVEARADLVDFFFVSNIDKLEQSFIFLHSNIVALECFNYITSVLVDCIQRFDAIRDGQTFIDLHL